MLSLPPGDNTRYTRYPDICLNGVSMDIGRWLSGDLTDHDWEMIERRIAVREEIMSRILKTKRQHEQNI